MKMWYKSLIPLLCNKHLLGMHFEIHLHRHNFVKRHSITGRVKPVVQIEPASMGKAHNALVKEMIRRGFNHNSPYEMPDISYLSSEELNVRIDLSENIKTLTTKCRLCKERISC